MPPRVQPSCPRRISAKASHWTWTQQIGSLTKVEIVAKDMRQIGEPSHLELIGVELRVFDKSDQGKFDKITSAKADFDLSEQVLFSDGEVEIILGMKIDPQGKEQPEGKLLRIKSSGVRFESKTAKVMTDRPAQFTFDRSEGQSTGAEYNSVSRELRMFRDVLVKRNGIRPQDKSMEVTAGNLLYKEAEAKIYLDTTGRSSSARRLRSRARTPWSPFRMDRSNSSKRSRRRAATVPRAGSSTMRPTI